MRKKIKEALKSSEVVLSALIVVFIFLGLLFAVTMLRQTRTQVQNMQRSQMKQACENFESQFHTMQEISWKIQNSPCYRDSYIEKNPYHEMELLQDFRQYRNNPPMDASYYLYNRKRNCFYSPTAKYAFSLFSANILKLPEDVLAQLLNEKNQIQVLKIENLVFFSFPIGVNGGLLTRGDNVLLFTMTQQQIQQYLENVSGLSLAQFSLSFLDTPVVQANPENAQQVSSPAGSFSLCYAVEETSNYQLMGNYERLLWIVMITYIVLVVAAFILLNYVSEAPVRKLAQRMNVSNKGDTVSNLEKAFELMSKEVERNSHLLDSALSDYEERTEQLRTQTLQALLAGKHDATVQTSLSALSIHFPHPYFTVWIMPVDSKSQSCVETLLTGFPADSLLAESLLMQKIESIVWMINMKDPEMANYLAYLLQEMEIASGKSLAVQKGIVVNSPDKISNSFASCFQSGTVQKEANLTQLLSDAAADSFILCMKAEKQEEAAACFSRFIDSLNHKTRNINKQRMVIFDLLKRMSVCAENNKSQVPEDAAARIMQSSTLKDYQEIIENAMNTYFDCLPQKNVNAETLRGEKISAYLLENLADSQLGMERLCHEFSLSSKQINAAIRAVTGKPYREYLVDIRMEKAKQLLSSTNLTVSEVAAQSGYENVSYFIQAFRQNTSFSPGEWRKNMKGV